MKATAYENSFITLATGFTDERYNETSYYHDPETSKKLVYPSTRDLGWNLLLSLA
jgi:hypothetical protein